LTVSRFEIAREFYRKLLPEFGMKPVLDGDKLFYCVGARTAIGHRTLRPGAGWRALCAALFGGFLRPSRAAFPLCGLREIWTFRYLWPFGYGEQDVRGRGRRISLLDLEI
jgi:hypothetical protein